MAQDQITTPRDFPAVEELLQSKELERELLAAPRPEVAQVVKDTVAALREKLVREGKPLPLAKLFDTVRREVRRRSRRKISRVINATGIVVHTNLGRAPLSDELFETIKQTVTGYGNIEFNVATGKRGKRGEAAEEYLAMLSGAEAGTVVNNCAAALFVILNTLASRTKVLISRGELVQIGGGFRIPDILKRSGAKLCEVGSTNITNLADYESAIDDKTGLILKVHKSNFVQAGFTEEVPLKKLVELGRKYAVPVLNDLGSGTFVQTRGMIGYDEPTVQDSVRAGASLTCFSGDKLLGGGQAGLIVGQANLVRKVKKNPIFRAVRVDKIVFSMLEKLLSIYLNGTYENDIKLWHIMSEPVSVLRDRAEKILTDLGRPSGISVGETAGLVGGGSLPEQSIASAGLVFSEEYDAVKLNNSLRALDLPVIGRIDDDRFILDLKAVDESDIPLLTESITAVLP